jgi:signal transduction histidine kinase
MQADTAALILLQEKELVYMAEAGVAEGLHGVRYEYGRDPIWEVLQGTEPLFITGGNNPLLKSWHFARLAMGEMQAGIFAPLRSSSVNVGLLFLGYSRQPELFQELTNLVVAISEIAGNALYRTETMETLERMVAERSKDLQTIYEVSTLANQEQDLDTTLARSLDHVLAAMHCRSGSIHLVDEVDEVLELVVARNTDPRLLPYIERIPFNEGLQGWVVSNGKSIMVPDISADSRAIRRDPIEDYNTYLGVPLRVGGKVLGVISVRREGDYPFNIDEIALLGSIADHVGISVENAYLTERSEEAAVIEERSRLARELHDSVTQSIYGVTLFAEAARQQMAAQEPPGSGGLPDQVNSLISRVRDVALQALKEMRLLVYELRPPALEQDGLVGGIQQRLDAVEGRVGIHTRLVYEQKPVMSIEQEEALYRITIEALNNILKHAHASEVVVRIETHDKCVSLEISDNGEGFDPGEIQSMGGLGLIGIRERVVRMGGELAIESEIGKGTCIRVNTPIQMSAGRRLRRQMKA